MQELFSKVNIEKRHLYGENGILGHRRAISTTVPEKNQKSSGHKRTYSNTSSDFKMIFSASPILLQQIEKPDNIPEKQKSQTQVFSSFLTDVLNYFTNSIVPTNLESLDTKLNNDIKTISENILILQKEQLELVSERAEIKAKIKEEIEMKKKSDQFLANFKKKNK